MSLALGNYKGEPIANMDKAELIEIIDHLAAQLDREYTKRRQLLDDPAYLDYIMGIRYRRVVSGLYKREVI